MLDITVLYNEVESAEYKWQNQVQFITGRKRHMK